MTQTIEQKVEFIKSLESELAKKDVLVVEDDREYLDFYSKVLGGKCGSLDYATNEEDAIISLNGNSYDVVFSDGAFPIWGVDRAYKLSKEDYRGNNVAKVAKEKGIYVCGVTSEPHKLNKRLFNLVIEKPFDVFTVRYIAARKPDERELNEFLEGNII